MTEKDPRRSPAPGSSEGYPDYGNHFRPRTRDGWVAVIAFLGLMVLAQPPVVHGLMDRVEPWLLGVPFLYAYLLLVYVAMIVVLIWAQRRGI